MKKIMASGYFDPIHIGHIEYLEKAKKLGDYLVVVVNTNASAIKKKGFFFMDEKERMEIVKALRCVDEVVLQLDKDATVAKSIDFVKPDIFAKGGDRNTTNLPENELEACRKNNVKIVTGLGDKIQASSKLIENYEQHKKAMKNKKPLKSKEMVEEK